jgi:putative ABC transport system permease protein
VTQRTQEIGIRLALGAAPIEIIAMVIRQGMLLAISGLVIGVVTAAALSRTVSSLLFGISATDGRVFGTVSVILALVAFFACYVPARRATRIDPIVALHME